MTDSTAVDRYRTAVDACMAEAGLEPGEWVDVAVFAPMDDPTDEWCSAIHKAFELCAEMRPPDHDEGWDHLTAKGHYD